MTENKRRRRTTVEVEPPEEGIYLDKKFRIMPLDDQQVTLQEYTKHEIKENKEKGIEAGTGYKWMWLSYHSSIPSAIKSYANLRCIRSKTIQELLDNIEEIRNNIDNLFEFKTDGKADKCKCS